MPRKFPPSPEYGIWLGMKNRCYRVNDKKYPRYGGRGIVVCDQWKNSFKAFLKDMGRRPDGGYSIDRIDNDGNYEPRNCRWATYKEQAKNRGKCINNTTGVTGVYWNRNRRKWDALITIDGKLVHLGRFMTIEEAAECRQAAAAKNGYSLRHGS